MVVQRLFPSHRQLTALLFFKDHNILKLDGIGFEPMIAGQSCMTIAPAT